jgi:hypothetical protein
MGLAEKSAPQRHGGSRPHNGMCARGNPCGTAPVPEPSQPKALPTLRPGRGGPCLGGAFIRRCACRPARAGADMKRAPSAGGDGRSTEGARVPLGTIMCLPPIVKLFTRFLKRQTGQDYTLVLVLEGQTRLDQGAGS